MMEGNLAPVMADLTERIGEIHIGHAGEDFNPDLLRSEVENYWKYQLQETTIRRVHYPSQTDTDRETANVTEMDMEDLICEALSSLNGFSVSDFIVIHSYTNLALAKPIHETDFLILSKTHGIFHLEQKGYEYKAKRVLHPTKPVCIRGAVLMATDQIKKRTEAIEAILKQDQMDVGLKGFGVTSVMVKQLIDRLKLSNRACVIPQDDSSIDVTEHCERPDHMCQKCDLAPSQLIDDSCARIFGPRDKLKENLKRFFEESLSKEPVFTNPIDQKNMYLLLIRRFVALEMQQNLPTQLLLQDADGMDGQIDTKMCALAREIASGPKRQKSILLSIDQQELLQRSDSKLFITGPAGSGKTVMLLLKAEQLMLRSFFTLNCSHNQLLIVCYTRAITTSIEQSLRQFYDQLKNGADLELSSLMPEFKSFATVTTFTKFLVEFCGAFQDDHYTRNSSLDTKVSKVKNIVEAMRGKPHESYAHILLDECQDFFGAWPPLFDLFLKPTGPGVPQCFWLFYDCNQTMWVNEYMKKSICPPTGKPVVLTKVFRSTVNLQGFAEVFTKFEVEVKMAHGLKGLKVNLDYSVQPIPYTPYESSLSELDLNAAVTHIHANVMSVIDVELGKRKRRLDIDDFPKDTLDNITVLVRNQTWADQISEKLTAAGLNRNKLKVVDAETIRKLNKDETRLDSVGRFKGLESRVILWFEPNIEHNEPLNIYSAATRATTALVIITTEASKDFLWKKIIEKGKDPEDLLTFRHLIPSPRKKQTKNSDRGDAAGTSK